MMIEKCIVCQTPEPELLETLLPNQTICTTCGWAYDENPIQETKLKLAQDFWDESHQFVCHGMMLGMGEGVKQWSYWLEQRRLKRLR